ASSVGLDATFRLVHSRAGCFARGIRLSRVRIDFSMRVIGLAGWSGSGKTTLLIRLIPVLVARGLSVSTIKHALHAFDVDRPGKDSFLHRQAGAREVLVASRRRWALMRELRDGLEPRLAELVALIDDCDILLVEGFKREEHVKVEVYRKANGKPPLHPEDGRI